MSRLDIVSQPAVDAAEANKRLTVHVCIRCGRVHGNKAQCCGQATYLALDILRKIEKGTLRQPCNTGLMI